MSYSKFSELGREFGTSLTSKALNEASTLWDKMDKAGRSEAQAAFYSEAEVSHKDKQVRVAKAKEQERLKAKAEAKAANVDASISDQ